MKLSRPSASARTLVWRYGVALAVVAVASALRRLIWPEVPPSPALFFYPAVFIAARLGGARAGYVATAAASFAIATPFITSHGVHVGSPSNAVDILIFACVGVAISAAVGKLDTLLQCEHAAALRAEEAKRSTDATWSMVAHDLRTPLDAINLGSSALGSRASTTAETERMLAIIKRSTMRASHLIDDAIDAMRAAEGRLRVEPAECDARELCAHAIDAVSLLASRGGVRLESDVATLHALVCDQPRLEQVLVNLLGNGIKFTPARGVVSLYVDEEEDGVHFTVRDTGRGIPRDELDSIFTKFWSSGPRGGSGLGLWIACAILQAHHARLTVESEVGVGTTFRFTLPKASFTGSDGASRAS